jgi:hypothetical protein
LSLTYVPVPSVQPFLTSDKFVALIVGPVGSTKTTAGIMRIAYKAKQMAPCRDGVRRSRAVWIRNTREQLNDTSIPDFLKWFPDGQAGSFMKTGMKFVLKFDDVECEVLFRGLDDTNDVRRLLSLQISFAIMDEFREIHPDIFHAVQGRLGRYPDGMMVPHRPEWGVDSKGNPIQGCVKDDGTSNKHIWGMTNPPDMDTFWEEYLSNPPANAERWIQPSGLSEEADWVKYLPTDYYENLAEGKTQDWIDVYINAQFGKSLSGQPVFRSFKLDYHVSKLPLKPIRMENYPLIIGADFGLTPACTINQIDPKGRLLTFADLTSEGMGAVRFIREKLKPTLAARFPGLQCVVVGDPAGVQRAQTDERSVFDIFKSEGFRIAPARTNALPARIGAVDNWLTRQADGGPAHLIDPSCKELIKALRGGYRYKIKTTNNEPDEKPEKNMSSHVADAHQYACLHADPAGFGGGLYSQMNSRREVKKSTYIY